MSFQTWSGLVPAPVAPTPGDGLTVLVDGTRVVTDPALRPAARWWRRVTEDAFGLDLVLATTPVHPDPTAAPSSDPDQRSQPRRS